jgi:hypothetical protein
MASTPAWPVAVVYNPNPTPILQQPKALMTTNPFIQPIIDQPPENSYATAVNSFFNDLFFGKPEKVSWFNHFARVVVIGRRPFYLGVFCLYIILIYLIVKNLFE